MKYNKEQLLKAIPVLCILLGVLLIGGGFAMADFKMENMRTVEQKPFLRTTSPIFKSTLITVKSISFPPKTAKYTYNTRKMRIIQSVLLQIPLSCG